jgi:hypothetical protein
MSQSWDHEEDYTNGYSLMTLLPEISLAFPTRQKDLLEVGEE